MNDESTQALPNQMKLLTIMEGGENEDQQARKESTMKSTTISWSPME
jgi:hypothetical protein